jgi:membrane-associated phospholipid phosphatase
MLRTRLLVLALGAALGACSDTVSPAETELVASRAPQPGESGATAHWHGVARGLVIKHGSNAFQAIRGYAILSVAQYNAVIAAERHVGTGPRASVRAAVSRASAIVLSYLYPAEAEALDAMVAAFVDAPRWPEENADAGDAAGRIAADPIVARARGDNFFAAWTGTVPTGPGMWFSATPPAGASFGKAKPFLLRAGDQFRPPPPPAFGSAEFVAALAEVRRVSDARTPQQDSIAKMWALPVGTHSPAGYWNVVAGELAARERLRERDVSHLLALMNMTAMDAIIATHDAKFTYWLIRPSQADQGVRAAIGVPNFPSYPSNHATVSAAMATLLASRFPDERARLTALAEEAAISRLYGGIHYRFDNETGLRLGRQIAEWALQRDVVGHSPFVLD